MLINCVAYEEGRKLAEVQRPDIKTYLARPGCFVWIAVVDPNEEELAELQDEFDLHPPAVEDARHGHQRPKIEEYGDELFMVLHMIEPAGEELRVGEVSIFVGRNYVLSVRSRAERGFHDVRVRCEREPELLRHGTGYVLYALMDAVGKLYGGRVPQVCQGMGEYFRDVYDHLVRLNQSLDSLRDTVATAIQVNLAMITIGESEVTKRLAAYAALVAVPTMIAGVYGMNFKQMPELNWEFGYPFAVSLMVVLDSILFWRFRKAKWL